MTDTERAARTHSSPVAQVLVGILVVLAATLAAIVAAQATPANSGSAAAAPAAPTGVETHVTVRISGMAFEPNVIEVPAGNRLVITLENTGDQAHDLALESGLSIPVLHPGESDTLDAGVISGTVDGWCSLPGHRAMGMSLVIVPVELDAATPATAPASHPDHDTDAISMASLLAQAERSAPATAELPPLPDSTVHEVTLRVTEHTEVVAEGVNREVWTYNGTSPGPTLHGRVGDTFVITLVNDGSMGHSIDFHAGELAPDGPMRTIESGESLTFEFTATRAGIWMYHCSTMPMSHHIAHGMFGAVVIEPGDLAPARSFVVIQSDIYLDGNDESSSSAKLAAGIPDIVAFNGRAFQYVAHPLTARAGERVRVWVLDAGPNAALSFHVVGTQFDTVWTEGAYSVRSSIGSNAADAGRSGAQVLPLLAAQGGFVEFVAPEAGHYPFVNHQMSLAEKGAQGVLEVTD